MAFLIRIFHPSLFAMVRGYVETPFGSEKRGRVLVFGASGNAVLRNGGFVRPTLMKPSPNHCRRHSLQRSHLRFQPITDRFSI